MPEGEPDIAYCHACGSPMDVSALAPFTNVACPKCAKHTRVKREFGPYTLMRRHAIGGMSMVFTAQDTTLDREAVVKILNEEYSVDAKRIAAFEEEARITASFSHPNVVRVFTTGYAFGRFYIAMEYVTGGHFEHHIRERGKIPEAEALPLAIQVAEGLKSAHAAGLIHRDVKPGNILLDGNDGVKIVDFGLALVTQGGKAQATEIWATPYYVPPETIETLPEDFRSDIYAFGASFYHALAGVPPCDEESMDTNRLREAKQKVRPLAEVAPHVSQATCDAIDRAMAYEPAARYRSYEDLIGALKSANNLLQAGKAEVAQSPASRRADRKKGGRLGEKIALAAALLLVFAAAGFSVWWVGQGNDGLEVEGLEIGPPVEVAPVVAPEVTPVVENGSRVAESYRKAGVALKRKDYDEARRLFCEVRDDPGVMEPTGSWAASEAVMAAFLAGRGDVARDEAAKALEHVGNAPQLDQAVGKTLAGVLGQVGGLEPVSVEGLKRPGGAEFLEAMMGALKNWEQGLPDQAEPLFKAVASAPGGHPWLKPYRGLAEDYLSDLEKLRQAEPKRFDYDPKDGRALIDELHALHTTLQTRGRAKFAVRSWQLELEKGMRRQPGKEVVVPEEDAMAAIEAAFEAYRFTEAVGLLKQWRPGDAGKEKRRALMLLAGSANGFLAELEAGLAEGAGVPVACRDGRRFSKVISVKEGQVMVPSEGGGEVVLGWEDFSGESLIDLYQAIIRSEDSEIERMRRHQQAVAFGLLAGDEERAREAGTKLAAQSPEYRANWERIAEALGL